MYSYAYCQQLLLLIRLSMFTSCIYTSPTQVRNLVYMVQRRERLKTRIMNCQQEMVDLEAGLLEAGLLDNDNQEEMQEEDDERDVHDGNNIMSGEEMEESEMKKEGQDDETMAQHSIRLTRYNL